MKELLIVGIMLLSYTAMAQSYSGGNGRNIELTNALISGGTSYEAFVITNSFPSIISKHTQNAY